jgi:hypothetical protein
LKDKKHCWNSSSWLYTTLPVHQHIYH